MAYVNPAGLVTIRQLRGKKPTQVAVDAQVSLSYYCEIEAGRKNDPSDDVLQRIADALGVDRASFAPLNVPVPLKVAS